MPGLLLLVLLTPLAATLLAIATRRGRWAGWTATGVMVCTTSLVSLAGAAVYSGRDLVENYLVIAPNIHLGLHADGLSVPVLGVVVLLCTVLTCYSVRYIEHRISVLYQNESEQTRANYFSRFFALLPFFPFGFIGTILSTNLISLYFFMEVLTITLFFLMASFGYRDRVRVAFISLSWGITGALLFLAASLIAYSQLGTFEISALSKLSGNSLLPLVVTLFLVSLLMKLAVLPFHVWMPSVHAEHQTCIAGLLAIYANLALYVIIRLLVLPLQHEFSGFGFPLMALALITMVYGSLLALAQTDIKRLAACSTISQIAYSVLGLGALTSLSVQGGLLFFLSHIMGKAVFFSAAGIVVYSTGIRDMRELGGLAQKMPLTAILWIVGAMMLSGFPPFSSFIAEWLMFTGVFERGLLHGPGSLAIAVGGVITILLTVAYTFGAARKIFFGPLNPALEGRNLSDPSWTMIAPLIIVAGLSALLGIYPRIILDMLHVVLGDI